MDGDPPQKAAHYEGKAAPGAAGHGLDAACKLVTRRYLQEALCTRKLHSETQGWQRGVLLRLALAWFLCLLEVNGMARLPLL